VDELTQDVTEQGALIPVLRLRDPGPVQNRRVWMNQLIEVKHGYYSNTNHYTDTFLKTTVKRILRYAVQAENNPWAVRFEKVKARGEENWRNNVMRNMLARSPWRPGPDDYEADQYLADLGDHRTFDVLWNGIQYNGWEEPRGEDIKTAAASQARAAEAQKAVNTALDQYRRAEAHHPLGPP
jgi:hypothetical protein